MKRIKVLFTFLLVLAVTLSLSFVFGSKKSEWNGSYNRFAFADELGTEETSNLSETKFNVSAGGSYVLLATAIKDTTLTYEVGYVVEGFAFNENDTHETTKVYSSITFPGQDPVTAEDIFGEDYADCKMIVWELHYSYETELSVKAYYINGVLVNNVLTKDDSDEAIENAVKSVEHVHYWNEGEITTPQTCTEKGVKTFTCACGETKTEEVDALGHVYTVEVADSAVTATCTVPGKEVDYKCSRCESVKTGATINPLGHAEVEHTAQEATCENPGWEAYVTCSRCDYTTKVEIPALGHDLVLVEYQAPTNENYGLKEHYECSRCGLISLDEDGETVVTIDELKIYLTDHSDVNVSDFVLTESTDYVIDLTSFEDFTYLESDINKLYVDGVEFSGAYSYESAKFTVDNASGKAIATGEHILTIELSSGDLYQVKFTVVSEVITTTSRFTAITKGFDSNTTDYYILGADLTYTEALSARGRIYSDATGDNWNVNFKGTIDGRGHTVNDLTIASQSYYSSSFIYNFSGTLKNIAFVNMKSTTKDADGGGLFTSFSGKLENVYVDITVSNTTSGNNISAIANSFSAGCTIDNSIFYIRFESSNLGNKYGLASSFKTGDVNANIHNLIIIMEEEVSYSASFANAAMDKCSLRYESKADFLENAELSSDFGGFEIDEETLYFNGSKLLEKVSMINITSLFTLDQGYGLIANTSNASFGNPFVEPAYACSNIVNISQYQGKTLRITLPSSTTSGLIFLNASQASSKEAGWSTTTDGTYYGPIDVVIPEGATYVRCCYYVTTHAKFSEIPFSATIIE